MKESGSLSGGYRWKEHKIKILRVNPEILGMLCLQSAAYKVTSGLPDDARCLGAHIGIQSGDILLKVESEEYEPVEQGAMVPYLDGKSLVIEDLVYKIEDELTNHNVCNPDDRQPVGHRSSEVCGFHRALLWIRDLAQGE